jgi:hypothetical protein
VKDCFAIVVVSQNRLSEMHANPHFLSFCKILYFSLIGQFLTPLNNGHFSLIGWGFRQSPV